MADRIIDGADSGAIRSEYLLGLTLLGLATNKSLRFTGFRSADKCGGLTQREVEKLELLVGECDGTAEGIHLGSTEFSIAGRAGYLRNNVRWVHRPHCFGPRAAYYLALLAGQSLSPSTFMITAPTVSPGMLTAEYFEHVIMRQLTRLGLSASLHTSMLARFPEAGLTAVHVAPSVIGGFDLTKRGRLSRIDIVVASNGTRPDRYRRFLEAIVADLNPIETCVSHRIKEGPDRLLSATLVSTYDHTIAGFCAVQNRSLAPKDLATSLGTQFRQWANSDLVTDSVALRYLLPAAFLSREQSHIAIPDDPELWQFIDLLAKIEDRPFVAEKGLLQIHPVAASGRVVAA